MVQFELDELRRERDELRAELETARAALATEMRFHDQARTERDDLINAATTAKNLLSRKHPNSVADCDGDAWEAWAVLEAALAD